MRFSTIRSFAILLLLAWHGAGEAAPLRVGLHDAEPVAFRDAAGQPSGFMVEVLEHIAAQEDWQIEYVDGSWGECVDRLRHGRIDLLFPILVTPERERQFDFSKEVMFATWGRVFARSGADIESILDLEGMRVALVRDDIYNAELRSLVASFGLHCSFREFETKNEVLEALDSGAADAVAIEGKAGFRRIPGRSIRRTPIVFAPAAPHFAAPKGSHRPLLDALDRRLIELKEQPDSIYYRAYDDWFGPRQEPGWPRWLGLALGGAAGLLVLLGTFVTVLRANVRAKTAELIARNRQLEWEIGERRRAERERRSLEEQLRQSQRLEAMGTLAAGMAHDFNNLLMVIGAQCSRARQRASSDESVRASLDVVEDAVEQARAFTRSLLTFARDTPDDLRPVDLRAALRVTVRMLQRTLPANIELHMQDDCPEPPWIRSDEAQLQQVVLNLAVNARDAMPDGGTLRILLQPGDSPHDEPPTVRMTVADNGIGIPEEIRSRIFEPFFSTKPRGRGTGLGLAFVHATVERLGGHIGVETGPDGSAFHLELPCVAAPAERSLEAETDCGSDGRGERVLLVEDEQQVREVLASYLVSRGYDVLQAADGQSGLEGVLRSDPPIELLIIDVDLPRRDGISVLREVRAREFDTPAIVITGGIDAELDGLSDARMLAKPFGLPELGRLMRRMLDDRPAGRART